VHVMVRIRACITTRALLSYRRWWDVQCFSFYLSAVPDSKRALEDLQRASGAESQSKQITRELLKHV
jgi:hypothetical protein